MGTCTANGHMHGKECTESAELTQQMYHCVCLSAPLSEHPLRLTLMCLLLSTQRPCMAQLASYLLTWQDDSTYLLHLRHHAFHKMLNAIIMLRVPCQTFSPDCVHNSQYLSVHYLCDLFRIYVMKRRFRNALRGPCSDDRCLTK